MKTTYQDALTWLGSREDELEAVGTLMNFLTDAIRISRENWEDLFELHLWYNEDYATSEAT